MASYLFTNDLRISVLSDRIKWVANYVQSGNDLKDIENKSDNNNAATLEFYFNLYQDTITCKTALADPEIVIRNFVKKFQFPNPRTSESLTANISEGVMLAPYRIIVSLLSAMHDISDNTKIYLTLEEILYYVFCNKKVYTNPSVHLKAISQEIIGNREREIEMSDTIERQLNWKQYTRQIREMMTIMNYASKSIMYKNGCLTFSPIPEEQEFLNELIHYKQIWYPSDSSDYILSCKEYNSYMDMANTPYNVIDFSSKNHHSEPEISDSIKTTNYRPFITAIKSKPFLLIAGISGTGKSRIVRELARACWDEGSEEYKAQKPKNFEMIQVKPNWHDSSELIGYVSRIDGEKYVVGPFLKFIAKAIKDPNTPYILCLDEMNLAPVEQYFAEYLSILESRKANDDGTIQTDPIIDFDGTDSYKSLIDQLFMDDNTERKLYLTEDSTIGKRLSLPQNLIVVGTVNMDETTFSFSRKVLDRAMTIEMNDVDLHGGLQGKYEKICKLGKDNLIGTDVEGVDVYEANKDVCDRVLKYLQSINDVLNNTPFKIAYRTRNEFLLYVVNNLPYNKNDNGDNLSEGMVIARALDEITSMKILSRIEGDDTKVPATLLSNLSTTISNGLNEIVDEDSSFESKVSLPKLKEMEARLESGYTSFWS